MILVYNEKGLNDTLLCILEKQNEQLEIEYDVIGDVSILKQAEQIVGINIAQAKTKFKSLITGVCLQNEVKLEQEVNAFLQEQTITIPTSHSLVQKFVIGYVTEKQAHPDSDKLSVCQVDVGVQILQIVCGAANVAEQQKVIVAQSGCMMPTGLIIEPSVLRKVASNGMICSGRELNLPEQYQTPGIMVLPETAPIGGEFFTYFQKEMMCN